MPDASQASLLARMGQWFSSMFHRTREEDVRAQEGHRLRYDGIMRGHDDPDARREAQRRAQEHSRQAQERAMQQPWRGR